MLISGVFGAPFRSFREGRGSPLGVVLLRVSSNRSLRAGLKRLHWRPAHGDVSKALIVKAPGGDAA